MIERDTSSQLHRRRFVMTAWSNSTTFSDTGLYARHDLLLPSEGQKRDGQLRLLQHRERRPRSRLRRLRPATRRGDRRQAGLLLAPGRDERHRRRPTRRGANPGTYATAPTLGAASLLAGDTTNKAVDLRRHQRLRRSRQLGVPRPRPRPSRSRPGSSRPRCPPPAASPRSLTKAGVLLAPVQRAEARVHDHAERHRASACRRRPARSSPARPTTWSAPTTARRSASTSTAPRSRARRSAAAHRLNSNPLSSARWDAAEEFFKGTIDEVAVYGSALSAARVPAHYTAGIRRPAAAAGRQRPQQPGRYARFRKRRSICSWTDNSTNEDAVRARARHDRRLLVPTDDDARPQPHRLLATPACPPTRPTTTGSRRRADSLPATRTRSATTPSPPRHPPTATAR